MRFRPFTWLLLSVMFFVAAFFFWRLGDEWAAKRAKTPAGSTNGKQAAPAPSAPASPVPPPITLLSEPTNQNPRLAFRLTNTPKTVGQLARHDQAILLENA